jgi:adenylate cyclase
MHIETERKFLVTGEYKHLAYSSSRIIQGYISSSPERSVRVRIYGDRAFLTIKAGAGVMSRFEWEKEISTDDAAELLKICISGIIDKTRWLVSHKGQLFEIDEFHADNEGLEIAEIELESEEQRVELPDFTGKEVTGDRRYYNSYLSRVPYNSWQVADNEK